MHVGGFMSLRNGPRRRCWHEKDVAAFCSGIEEVAANGECISHTFTSKGALDVIDAVEEWVLEAEKKLVGSVSEARDLLRFTRIVMSYICGRRRF